MRWRRLLCLHVLIAILVFGVSGAPVLAQLLPDVLPPVRPVTDVPTSPAIGQESEPIAQAIVRDGQVQGSAAGAGSESVRQIEAFKVQSEATLRYSILVIAASAAMLALFALMHAIGRASFDFSKHYIVLVVISCSILLLIMGYTEQQIAPAYGLLGTVLGYIFGRSIGEADAKSSADAAAAAQGLPHTHPVETPPAPAPAGSAPAPAAAQTIAQEPSR